MISIAQMLAEAERVHAANLEATAVSGRHVTLLRARLAQEHASEKIGVKAAARLAGVHPRTIVRKARSGGLQGRQVGERWEFESKAVIEAFRAA